jgi:hypothetical protein
LSRSTGNCCSYDAVRGHVLLAGPAGLLAILWGVAYGFQQDSRVRHAHDEVMVGGSGLGAVRRRPGRPALPGRTGSLAGHYHLPAGMGPAREVALTDEEYQSPLARRPYDLRHACLSTWLNGGVAPTQVAEWAGHSRSMPAVALSIDNSRKASRNQMANPYVRTRIGTVCADRCSSAGRGAVSYTAGRTGTHLVNCYQVH